MISEQQGGTGKQNGQLFPTDMNIKQNGVYWSKAYISASNELLNKDFPLIYR